MSCFMGCDVNSRTAPWWVTGDLMLTVFRTLGGKCYAAMFPGVVLSHSLAATSLWLRSLEAENQTDGDVFVFKRCQSVFCVFTARPCRWKVKAVGVKDASALICLLPGGPEREKRRTLTILGCTKQAFLTPRSTCLCLGCSGTRPWAGVYTLTRSFSGYRKYSTRYRAALTEHRWRWHLF